LGKDENFVLYRWFAIPRRSGLVITLSTVGAAILLTPIVERSLRSLLAGLRRRWAAILLIAISTSVALVALEATMRLVDGVPVLSSENFVSRQIDHVHHTLSIYDPLLGWVLAPNIGDPGLTTGQFGAHMPGTEIVPLQQGVVIAVGDSFTAGSEVANAGSWPAQLEGMIGTQVINLASGGWGVDQIVLRAEDMIPRLNPKMLLVGILAEDSLNNANSVYGGGGKPYFLVEEGRLTLHNVPVPPVVSSVRDLGLLRATLGHSYLFHQAMTRLGLLSWWAGDAAQYHRVVSDETAVQISCLLMKRLASLSHQRPIRIGVIVEYGAPNALEEEEVWFGKDVANCARDAGLDVLDMYGPLHEFVRKGGEAALEPLYVKDDNGRVWGHMSEAGNRLVATEIARRFFGKGDDANENQ
jgi:hypothetical protein